MVDCNKLLFVFILFTHSLSKKKEEGSRPKAPKPRAISLSGVICCGKAVENAVVVLYGKIGEERIKFHRVRTNSYGQFMVHGIHYLQPDDEDLKVEPALRVSYKCGEYCDYFYDLFKPEFGTDVEEVHDLGVIQLTRHSSKVNITPCPKTDEEEDEEEEEEE
ncbi:unnamed protein product [Haemonchus placei]|uniref:Transthyretin-like family protein n=1 Tax=Haemonchus placei TaxID=6290 RepID=A0A0N4W1D9_HAEPC|nr:unnamed protein product [Haemonchus placei]